MPVYESHLTDYSILRVGRRVCEERQRHGLTLQDLAGRSGISTSRLSQIENALHVPDVNQLRDIAKALGVSIDFFLPSDRALPYQVTRYSDARTAQVRPPAETGTAKRCECLPLADLFVGRQIDPFLVRLLPDNGPHFRCHPGPEFVFVLKGRIEFTARTIDSERREELERGDCIYIGPHQSHSWRCIGNQPAECIHVLSSATTGLSNGSGWSPAATNGHHPDHIPTENGRLGAQIAALRRARGWTLADVAHGVDMKERHLEQVEQGERPMPLDVLLKLARVFGKPLRELLHDASGEGSQYAIRRSQEIPHLAARPRSLPTDRPHAPTPNSYHPLFGDFPTLHMYPYFVRIRNVDLQTLTPHEHHGQEFFYVLDGHIEVITYAEEREVSALLGPGDSCLLDASVPHVLRGEARNPYSATSAEVICLYWCPLGEEYLFGQATADG